MHHHSFHLGHHLRVHLRKKRISQVRLSKEIGMGASTLHSYIYGEIPKGVKSVVKIAKYLNIGVDELLFGRGDRHD